MSLKSDIVGFFGGENKWPGGIESDVDNVTLVSDEIVDHGRWSVIHEAVYLRKEVDTVDPLTFRTEYVRVTYQEPATEEQEWDGFNVPDIEEVVPVEYTAVRFETKE